MSFGFKGLMKNVKVWERVWLMNTRRDAGK
jgi:hypothetical protein